MMGQSKTCTEQTLQTLNRRVVKMVRLSVNTIFGKRELQTWGRFLPTIVLASIAVLLSPRVSAALGPWKAQVVDAETKKPLDDVVVIAVWSTYWS